jgi:hypothetical protein
LFFIGRGVGAGEEEAAEAFRCRFRFLYRFADFDAANKSTRELKSGENHE